MFKLEMKGFRELEDQIAKLERNLNSVSGRHSVRIDEILTPEFMRQNTPFSSVNDMFDNAPFKIESNEDFEKLPQSELDEFIRSKTQFRSWDEVLSKAGEGWVTSRVFKGL